MADAGAPVGIEPPMGSTVAWAAPSFNRPAIWRGVRPRPRSAKTRSRLTGAVSIERCWGEGPAIVSSLMGRDPGSRFWRCHGPVHGDDGGVPAGQVGDGKHTFPLHVSQERSPCVQRE